MRSRSKTIALALTLAVPLGLPIATHAQQGGKQGMSGMTMQGGHGTSGTTGMSNMQSMMDRCVDMRRQMAQGKMSSGPDMRDMKSQCDQMGNMPGMGAQAPAGTRSR
jgi:hypothetical protein